MSDTIRTAVARILNENGISFSATYRGEEKNAFGENGHVMDKWQTTFSRGMVCRDFNFYTGLGLRAEATPNQKRQARFEFSGLTENDITRRTMYGRRYLQRVESLRTPKAPDAADALHSIILDSSAVGQSFNSWCADFGYDSDSRKAFATYEACLHNADDIRAVIPADVLRALSETLEGY